MKYIKLILIAIVVFSFSACGGNGEKTLIDVSNDSGINKIEKYARDGRIDELTIQDYREANFHAVTDTNIKEYNDLVNRVLNSDKNLTQELDKLDARLNQKPIAHSQNISLNENSEINITLSGEDEDVENLAYEIISQPSHGLVESTYPTISGRMAHYTYRPNRDYDGSDSFSFRVFDGREYSDVVTVGINIRPLVSTLHGNSKITGLVKEIGTDIKLNGVSVVLKNNDDVTIRETITNSDGIYSFDNLMAGLGYSLEYQKENYSSLCYKNINLDENQTKSLETATLSKNSDNLEGEVSGRIIDAITGYSVSGVVIKVRKCINNTDDTVISEVQTDSNGMYYLFDIPQGTYTIETVKEGYNSSSFTIISIGGDSIENQNSSISPILDEGEMRIVLNWGEYPSDLDAHLVRKTDDEEDYHIYFGNKGQRIQDAILDRDDTTSYGPETITIYNPSVDSVYTYYIYNYSTINNSNATPLKDSNAKVEIIFNDIRRTFNVPNEDGTYWKVFDIINGDIVPCSMGCVVDSIY